MNDDDHTDSKKHHDIGANLQGIMVDATPPVEPYVVMKFIKARNETNIAASLDEQLMTRQPGCTCVDPYYCDGSEYLL